MKTQLFLATPALLPLSACALDQGALRVALTAELLRELTRSATTPALTKPTTITVIAVEEWMTPVMSVPAITPLIGVPAALARNWRIRFTESAWMPLIR